MNRPLLRAQSAPPLQIATTDDARARCADPAATLAERLDALEDLAESEVGDTPLLRARGLERAYGLRQLYLKVEGDNPTGTQKDRIAFAQVLDAVRREAPGVCFATCGNYGVAMAWAAQAPALRCVAVVPTGYQAPRIGQIEALGAEVVRAGHDYEEAVEAAKELAVAEGLYDANPGGANEPLQVRAYREIATEIYDELRDAPAAVAVPVSNGTTLAGVHRGFASLLRRGKTSRMPAVVAGSAYRKNPIVRSFALGHARCEDLAPDDIRETAVNEPLINWHALDGDAALHAVRSTEGAAVDVSDRTMKKLAKLLREEQGLHVQPASTAGLAALLTLHAEQPLRPDRYVAVLTGRSA